MVMKPVSFQSGELVTVPSGGLDPAVLPSTVVTTDGAHPFVAAQAGVNAVADTDLATLSDVKTTAGSKVWQAPVLSLVSSLPGSPSVGARHILISTQQINQWNGSAWVVSAPAAGWTTWNVATSTYLRYSTGSSTWVDLSTVIDHTALTNMQGGSSGQRYHLSSTEYGLLNSSQAARVALIAPTGGGVITARLLTMADITTGILSAAQGGLGLNASASNGYALWSGGSVSFSVTIPWSSLSSVPSTFAPAAHATSHGSGGSDQLGLDGTQITSGFVPIAFGGTGLDGSALPARRFLASPTGASGAWAARAIVPDDISGASAAGQVLTRNAGNTANVWAVPTASFPNVAFSGTPVGTRGHINFTGDGVSAVTDDSGTDSVTITIPGPTGMSPVVAALVLGG